MGWDDSLRKSIQSLAATVVIALFAGATLRHSSAENSSPGRTPVFGWSSLSFLRKDATAEKMKAQALALHKSGLQELGYPYVNLDDFWYQRPGPQGPNVDAYTRIPLPRKGSSTPVTSRCSPRPSRNGDGIIGLFKTGEKAEEVSLPAPIAGLPKNKSGYSIHDLWTGETKKTGSTISAVVPSHGVVLYRLRAL